MTVTKLGIQIIIGCALLFVGIVAVATNTYAAEDSWYSRYIPDHWPGQSDQVSDNATAPSANPFASDLVGGVGSKLPQEYTYSDVEKGSLSVSSWGGPVATIIGIIRILLSFLGIGTIGLMIYAGAKWMTAGGSADQVGDAKKTLKNATIGLIVIAMAYSLSYFIGNRIQRYTGSYGGYNASETYTPPKP